MAEKDLMTTVQQAELQGQLWSLVEKHREKHQLSQKSIWFFLMAFGWGYARRQGASNEEITKSAVKAFETNELAYQKATAPKLPGLL